MLLLQVIVGGLLLGAIYALFSSGLTLIWGMMNFINFAHGEFVMATMPFPPRPVTRYSYDEERLPYPRSVTVSTNCSAADIST